jgi:hypothetical protein
MTVAELESKVRKILLDTIEPYRWDSNFIRETIADAVAFLQSIRPETRYVNGKLFDGDFVPDDDLDPFPISDRYREGIVAYMAYKCLECENPDIQNLTLAENYLNKAKTLMQI